MLQNMLKTTIRVPASNTTSLWWWTELTMRTKMQF